VVCKGEININTEGTLLLVLNNLGPLRQKVVIDLTDTNHLHVGGYRIIHDFTEKLKQIGKEVKILARPTGVVSRILKHSEANQRLQIEYV
jgi:hypothetical protein